jgi:biopolymer transport protein ExbD
MKYSEFVRLIALTITVVATSSTSGQTPVRRQGVSVQLVSASKAIAFPMADDADAWVVAITADGRLYFGAKSVTPEQLREEMRITPHSRDAKLYIKADARANFAALKQVLHAAHEDLFETVVLLTQKPANDSGQMYVPPYGLEVSLALPSADATVVQLQGSGGPNSILKVNDQEFQWSQLQSALTQASLGRSRKLVVIEANGVLAAAPVVRAIDLSRSIGASVAISLVGS